MITDAAASPSPPPPLFLYELLIVPPALSLGLSRRLALEFDHTLLRSQINNSPNRIHEWRGAAFNKCFLAEDASTCFYYESLNLPTHFLKSSGHEA